MSIIIGNTTIDGRYISVGKASAILSRREIQFLTALHDAGGMMLSRERMQSLVDDDAGDATTDKNLDVILHHLRRKLAQVASDIQIETLWGTGWVLHRENKNTTLMVTPRQLAALRAAVSAYEVANPRIAEIARSAL